MEIDVSFFSSGYLDVSVPRVPACRAIHSPCGSRASLGWVSPFEYLRIDVCLRLPAAFRSWPRPSSAIGALASTLCSSSLDFFLRPTSSSVIFTHPFDWSFDSFSFRVQLSRCAWALSRPLQVPLRNPENDTGSKDFPTFFPDFFSFSGASPLLPAVSPACPTVFSDRSTSV